MPQNSSTIVTANARLSRELRREFDAAQRGRGERLWESPDILPREAWLTRIWQECAYQDPLGTPLLLSAAQEHALWEQTIHGGGAGPKPDYPLLNIGETARHAAHARNLLHAWRAEGLSSSDTGRFQDLPDTEAFLGWMQALDGRLAENGWVTLAQLPALIAERVRAGAGSAVQVTGPIAYAGFDEIAPADGELFGALRQAGCEVSEHTREFERARSAVRVSRDSAAEEIAAAAMWARRQLEARPGVRIGVVVRGLAGCAAMVERTFDDILHPEIGFGSERRKSFQVSAGTPVPQVPILSAALLLLRLADGSSREGLPISETGPLLRSPFTRLSAAEGARIDQELRRMGVETVTLEVDPVRRHFSEAAALAAKLGQKQRASQWSSAFSKLLKAAGWPGHRALSGAEFQALEQWERLLSDFARLDLVLPRMSYGEAVTQMGNIARASRFRAADEDAPVQIMDVPEAAGARFDALWVAGMHAGVWPPSPRPNPFLPLALQRTLNLPQSSVERELNHAREVTGRLMESAGEIVFSHPRHAGEEPLQASPLIEAIPEAAAIRDAAMHDAMSKGVGSTDGIDEAVPQTALRWMFTSAVPLEELPDARGPALPAGSLVSGGTSMIKNQAACPFRAFAVHRLGAREVEEAPLGISPMDHGTVAHQALDVFWREVRSRDELMRCSPAEVSEAVRMAVNAALDERLKRREKSASLDRFRALEEARVCKLMEQWLLKERTREAFTVVQTEAAETVTLGELQLRVRADRIDQFAADGKHAILDYKTGKVSSDEWSGDRPEAPQLPLYAITSSLPISEVAFAQISTGQVGLISEHGGELDRSLPGWRKALERLAGNFLAGEASVDPKNGGKTCSLCALESFCRIAEHENAAQSEGANRE